MAMDEQKQIKQLIMLISDLRARDQEKYESHIKFMNEVVNYIKDISKNLNQTWTQVHEKLENLNHTISTSLETLLQGIKPEDIRETSKSLENIMGTMNRSIQSMNLENVMRELRVLSNTDISFQFPAMGASARASAGAGVRTRPAAKTVANVPPELAGYASPALQETGQEIYGAVPGKKKKVVSEEQEKGTRDDMGRLKRKPRDLFGNPVE